MVIAHRLGLNKLHGLRATEARVPHHPCAAERGQDALGHHRLEHEKQSALRNRAPSKRAVTMRPFRDVVAVEAALVVSLVTDARALLRS
jgi:hypothetical protein